VRYTTLSVAFGGSLVDIGLFQLFGQFAGRVLGCFLRVLQNHISVSSLLHAKLKVHARGTSL
jgi:hypothetical protein